MQPQRLLKPPPIKKRGVLTKKNFEKTEYLPSNNKIILLKFKFKQLIGKFEPYFDHTRPFSGPVSSELDGLYEGSEVVIKSHVIVPMNTPEWRGVILLGSKDVDRYRGDLETEFLSLLRDILVLTVVPMLRNEGFKT